MKTYADYIRRPPCYLGHPLELAAAWLERLIFFMTQLSVSRPVLLDRLTATPEAMTTKNSINLTLYDRLSRLTFAQATRLLGPEGSKLLTAGGKHDIDIDAQIELGQQAFRLSVDGSAVTLSLDPAASRRLHWDCNICDVRASTPAPRSR